MKKVYEMIDGIPIWQHLKNGAKENKVELTGSDYGKFSEMLGRRILRKLTEKGGIIKDIFPGVTILSVNRISNIVKMTNYIYERGDYALEVHYKVDGDNTVDGIETYGKKIIIFEIKYGRFHIEQYQIRRYCSMINCPDTYFHKADEVKVIFMVFDNIDTMNRSASYSVTELDKDLASKILGSDPMDKMG